MHCVQAIKLCCLLSTPPTAFGGPTTTSVESLTVIFSAKSLVLDPDAE